MSVDPQRFDVVLVRPWSAEAVPENALVEDSLGVGYLAATLRHAGYSVAILDAFTLFYSDDDLVDAICQLSPRVVGFSLHSFYDYKHICFIAPKVRKLLPETFMVIGGEHATFTSSEVMNDNPSIDALVRAEGEYALVEICESLFRETEIAGIPGSVVRSEGKLVNGPPRPAIDDLDDVPFPEKDIIELALMKGRSVALSILSGRGCTHRCTFCTAHNFLRLGGGKVWRRRSPKNVVEELELLFDRYYGRPGVHPMIQFQDVIFLGTSLAAREWTQEFIHELRNRSFSVPFYIMARADAVIAHESMMSDLADVGLSSVEVGLESGVDRILESYNKANSSADLFRAVEILKENQICFDASGFIMFDPRMTLDELRVNGRFLWELGHATWDRYVTKLQVFPGTAIRDELVENQIFDPNAGIDQVYAYTYVDAGTATVAKHTFIYDLSVQELDVEIHNLRANIAEKRRGGQDATRLTQVLRKAEKIYFEHFMHLVDLAEDGKLEFEFRPANDVFLVEVSNMLHLIRNARHEDLRLVET